MKIHLLGLVLCLVLVAACTTTVSEKSAAQPSTSTQQSPYVPKTLASAEKAADLVLINGKVITVDTRDSIFQGVAVKNGKIVKVGTNQEVGDLMGPQTDVWDLKGKTVTPGLIDARCHPSLWCRYDERVLDLLPINSKEELLKLVADKAKITPRGNWIAGKGCRLAKSDYPYRQELDAIAPDNPVFLSDFPGVCTVANSYALKLASITGNTPNPYGGVIEKDANGEPNGLLINIPASWQVTRLIPGMGSFTMHDQKGYVLSGLSQCLANGVTYARAVNNEDPNVYEELRKEGKLPIAVQFLNQVVSVEHAAWLLNHEPPHNEVCRFAGAAMMVDGLDGSGTALMYDTSLPAARNSTPNFSQEDLNQIVSMFHKRGYQVALHVWGDRAMDMALDAIEAAVKETPKECRHTLEHVIYPSQRNLERIKDLGVIVSAQPAFVSFYAFPIKKNVTEDIAQRIMPFKTILDMGIPLAFGSEIPNVPYLDSCWGFIGAVLRTMMQTGGREVDKPKECLTAQQALRCYTMGSAYVTFQEKVRGSIEEGKIADMVVWSHDLYSMYPQYWRNLKAEITLVGGKVVYKTEGSTLSLVKGSEFVTAK